MRRFVTIAFVPAAAIVSSVAVYHNRKYFRTFNIFRARHKTIEMYPLAEETVQMSFWYWKFGPTNNKNFYSLKKEVSLYVMIKIKRFRFMDPCLLVLPRIRLSERMLVWVTKYCFRKSYVRLWQMRAQQWLDYTQPGIFQGTETWNYVDTTLFVELSFN